MCVGVGVKEGRGEEGEGKALIVRLGRWERREVGGSNREADRHIDRLIDRDRYR